MDDESILTLYHRRETAALTETASKYGHLCSSIAGHILGNPQDAEECVKDTWLHAWNAIPPAWPQCFSAWLSRVTRNLAISRLRKNTAAKRCGEELPLLLDELAECLPGGTDPQLELEGRELAAAVDRFLSMLKPDVRNVFIARYFYAASLTELASRCGWTVGKLKTVLHRTRLKLRDYLKEEGLC